MKKAFYFSLLVAAMLILNNNKAMAQYSGQCGQQGDNYYCSAYSQYLHTPSSKSQTWTTSQTGFWISVTQEIYEGNYPYGRSRVQVSFGNYYYNHWCDEAIGYHEDYFYASSGTSVSSITLDTYAKGGEASCAAAW